MPEHVGCERCLAVVVHLSNGVPLDLIVEDDATDRRALARHLASHGYVKEADLFDPYRVVAAPSQEGLF